MRGGVTLDVVVVVIVIVVVNGRTQVVPLPVGVVLHGFGYDIFESSPDIDGLVAKDFDLPLEGRRGVRGRGGDEVMRVDGSFLDGGRVCLEILELVFQNSI